MAKSTRQKLDDLIEKLIPVLRNAFLAAVQGITDEARLNDLITRIKANDYEGAFRQLGMSPAALRPITAALEAGFEAGGNLVSGTFPISRAVYRFDVRNVRAENWLKDASSSLVTRISEDARVAVMNVMQSNLELGNNPRQTALDIIGRIDPATGKRVGGIIGLNQPQELAVRNAYKDLVSLSPNYFNRLQRDKRFDSIVQKAIRDKKPLDADTIARLISRYKDNLLRLRGETVARTETIQSLNRSEWESYKQVVELGAVKQSDVQKAWDTAGDFRVRHDHRAMDGQTVGLDEPFVAPDGSRLMHPGDISLHASAKEVINCRCRALFKVDWLANLD